MALFNRDFPELRVRDVRKDVALAILQSSLVGNIARYAQEDCGAVFDRIPGACKTPENEEATLVVNGFSALRKPSPKVGEAEVVLGNLISIEAKSCQSCQLRLFLSAVRVCSREPLTLEGLECRINFLKIFVAKLQGVRRFVFEISP